MIVLVLLRVYDLIRARAAVRRDAAMRHGRDLFEWESRLAIQVERPVNHWLATHDSLSWAASYFYQYAHVSVTLTMLAWCWWRRPEHYRSARNSLVLINVVALLTYFLYPVAPPRLLAGQHFIDTVALAGFGTTHGGPVTADQYGAMPSLHVGWALWTALVGYRLVASPVVSRAWLAYPFVTCFVIVATGNHYILDAVAGAVLAVVAQRISGLGSRRLDQPTPTQPRRPRPCPAVAHSLFRRQPAPAGTAAADSRNTLRRR